MEGYLGSSHRYAVVDEFTLAFDKANLAYLNLEVRLIDLSKHLFVFAMPDIAGVS